MYNVILDELPDYIEIDGRYYPVNTDFKSWLEFNRAVNKPDLTANDVLRAFAYVFEEIPDDEPERIAGALMAFMNDEPEKLKTDDPEKPVLMRDIMETESENSDPIVVDYNFDSDYIFAAFMQQYGINLFTANLHWYEFKALFAGLSKPCKIIEIMGYRAVSDSDYAKMSKSEKEHIKKMKKLFALPDRRTAEQIEADFADGL